MKKLNPDLFFKKSNFSVLVSLTKRHFLVFLKNKIRVLYTLMVPVIVFLIYILLLRSLEGNMLESALKDLGLYNNGVWVYPEMQKDCYTMMDFWMLAGLLGISAITISIQSNNIMINDKENGVNRDFVSSPISNKILITSYFFFNFLVTLFLCTIFLFICLLYLGCVGEFILSFADVMLIFVMLVVACLASTFLTIFICSFINREPTLASIIAIFSSAAGFLVGAYMPFALFPRVVESSCCFIPLTHNVSLLRYAFLNHALEGFKGKYAALLDANTFNGLMNKVGDFGYELHFFGMTVTPAVSTMVVGISIVVFMFLSIIASRFITRMEKRGH